MVRDAGEGIAVGGVRELVLVRAVEHAVVHHAEAVRHPDVAGKELRVDLSRQGDGAASRGDVHAVAVTQPEIPRISAC